MRVSLGCIVTLVLIAISAGEPQLNGMRDLEAWVIAHGGMTKAEYGYNKRGFRGIFAKEAIKKGDPIMIIPASCSINVGSLTGSFLTPSLLLLRELRHPDSRFKPYLNIFPKRDEVVNACNLDKKYWHMLPTPLLNMVQGWQGHMEAALNGEVNLHLEYTPREVLGNINGSLTLDDLKYACALSSTRYVSTNARQRLMMFPLFDLMNHQHQCLHFLSNYDEADEEQVIAGKDVEAGEELCYGYGTMRDDYAVMHYGFLPDLEDPPRLLELDHHQYDSSSMHQSNLSEERFEGTEAELQAELSRQQATLKTLQEEEDTDSRVVKGQDPVYDVLKELQWRRRNALRYEIKRLQEALQKTEL
ncbi:hypothetical protein V8C86DRAFT_2751589 [Haematococcus lacustris]